MFSFFDHVNNSMIAFKLVYSSIEALLLCTYFHTLTRLYSRFKKPPYLWNFCGEGYYTTHDNIIFSQNLLQMYESTPIAQSCLEDVLRLWTKPCPFFFETARYIFEHLNILLSYADISKAQKELCYQPKVDLEVGLAKFVKWFKEREGLTSSDAWILLYFCFDNPHPLRDSSCLSKCLQKHDSLEFSKRYINMV